VGASEVPLEVVERRECGEAMIVPPVAVGSDHQDGAGWWHVGGE